MKKQKGIGLNLLISTHQPAHEADDQESSLFSAKEVEKHLGIEPKTLHNWMKSWKLVKTDNPGPARGLNSKFSLENLATLSLIKILNECHIEPLVIGGLINNILYEELEVRKIKARDGKTKFFLDPEKFNLWKYYRIDPKQLKKSGFYLLLSMPLNGQKKEIGYTFGDFDEMVELLRRMRNGRKDFKNMAGVVVIDLIAIIYDIEEKTGAMF